MGSQQRNIVAGGRRMSSPVRVTHTVIFGRQWAINDPIQTWRPPTDVYETEAAVIVKMEIAGMSEDEFHITYADGQLVVGGVRRDAAAKLGYHQMEISYGEFHVEINLPKPVDVDKIEASYSNGFLIISLPIDERRFSYGESR